MQRVVSTIQCIDCIEVNETVCISTAGKVYSFGSSYKNGLKQDNTLPPKLLPFINIKMIACGDVHLLCLDIDGNVFSYGRNSHGQLGVRKKKHELEYTEEPLKISLPPCKEISCGKKFSICLTEEGDLYSFGYNYFGQLGHCNAVNYNYPKRIKCLKNIEFVECGALHVVAKNIENENFVWGGNSRGQLGLGYEKKKCNPLKCKDWPDDIVDIKCGIEHTLVLTSSQKVYTCGGYNLTIKHISSLSNIIRIECGDRHSMCIDDKNDLYVFGNNRNGQLGLGIKNPKSDYNTFMYGEKQLHTSHVYKPKKHPLLSYVIDLSSGGDHTFIRTASNEIFSFGKNSYSQTGTKYTDSIFSLSSIVISPTRVFEDNEDIWRCSITRSRAKSARK